MKKLKITSLILVVVMLFSMLPMSAITAFAATIGSQTKAAVDADYTIGTADEFVEFMNNWMGKADYYTGKTVVLTADIDLSETTLPKLHDGSAKITNTFTGTLDGQNHTISGYAVLDSRQDGTGSNINDQYGLFGKALAGTATFKNITFDGVVGTEYYTTPKSGATGGAWNVGALYGDVLGTAVLTIENVRLNGIVFGRFVGGFAAFVKSGATVTVNNSEVGGMILQNWTGTAVGGFFGATENGTTVEINDSVMSGTVALLSSNTNEDGLRHAGGFVGQNGGNLDIDDSIVSGTVVSHTTAFSVKKSNGQSKYLGYIGGFVGNSTNDVSITDSMMIGTVESMLPQTLGKSLYDFNGDGEEKVGEETRNVVGGFIGYAKGTAVTMTNCAMYGIVKCNYDAAGGLAGQLYPTAANLKVNNCIHAGTVYEGTGVSGRYVFGASDAVNSSYNIQIGTANYGAQYALMGGSAYTVNCTRADKSSPYCIPSKNHLTDANFDATINALTTYDASLTAAFATEKEEAISLYRANWNFCDGLPVPKGCSTLTIHNEEGLLAFARAINNGYDFAGMTIQLANDIVMNEGWDAFATTVTAPETVWPLNTNNKKFAGTFDGQGHTISGIYLAATGQGVGIFGNIATGTVGEVKNVAIVNSYVQGNSDGTGGIFGEVEDEATSKITDPNYVNKTKAIVNNVYADINIYNNCIGNNNLGTGGIIGGSRTDVEITNTMFVGKVYGGCRGVAAFVGGVRAYQNSTDYYLNTITIENCYADAVLIGRNDNNLSNNTSPEQTFVGALVGYSNSYTTTHNIKNVISTCSIDGAQYDGYLYGGAWCNASASRDGTTMDYQYWNLTDVYYLATAGTASKAVGTAPGGSRYNGEIFNAADFPALPSSELTAKSDAWLKAMGEDAAASFVAMVNNAMEVASVSTGNGLWYILQTTDATPDVLEINNVNDLIAFSNCLQGGVTFAGKTIKLNNDIVMNEGWNAFATTVTEPVVTWGNTQNRYFAGTFDGQGHVISGIYLATTGENVGIFGNVNTGTMATVKNVAILNSYVTSNNQAVGGIFGQIADEVSSAPITDDNYVNKTKGIIDNVYLDANILNTLDGNNNLGTGGFIGGTRADASITNSVFAGKVTGGMRGAAAFIGATRPKQITYGGVDEVNLYRIEVTIQNCIFSGEVIGKRSGNVDFAGVLGGYVNSNTETWHVDNLISVGTVSTSESSDTYKGYLIGGTYSGPNAKRKAGVTDYTYWYLNDVVVFNAGNLANAVGNVGSGSFKYVIDGVEIGTGAAINAAAIKTQLTRTADKVWNENVLNFVTNMGTNENLSKVLSNVLNYVDAKDAEMVWYLAQTTDATPNALYINDANDLLGFAYAIKNNADFAGKTVYLNADIKLNEGWDAFAETVTAPSVVWPSLTGKYFNGTFDGQNHTISGLYQKTTGFKVGFFGNVKSQTTATVKNLSIVNSYIASDGAAVGSIFGEIEQETNKLITDPLYINKTKGVIDNVSLTVNVYSALPESKGGNENMGVGGFVGGTRADLTITNSTFAGRVESGFRGVAGFVGATRPVQDSYDYDADGANTKGADDKWYKEDGTVGTAPATRDIYRIVVKIENCTNRGDLIETNGKGHGFVGGLVGYANANTETFYITNVITGGTITYNDKTMGVGSIYGGNYRDEAGIYRISGHSDYQEWYLNNVTILDGTGAENAIGRLMIGQKWYVDGDFVKNDEINDYLKGIVKEPSDVLMIQGDLVLEQSVTLTNSLALNLYVKATNLVLKEAGKTSIVAFINGKSVTGTLQVDGRYKFVYTGVLPQQMMDEFTFDLEAETNNQTKTVTVQSYLAVLARTPSKYQKLASDLLRYGAAAQKYTNYKTDTLATAGLSLATGSVVGAMPNVTVTKTGDLWVNASLRLENSLAVVFTANAELDDVTVTIGNKKATAVVEDNQVIVYVGAADMNKTIRVASGNSVVNYSVATYVARTLNNDAVATEQKELVRAIYAYGLSAAECVAS